MKKILALLTLSLLLAFAGTDQVLAQAGTGGGQINETYKYQLSNVLGTSFNDSLTWSNATRKTKKDTLVGTEKDTTSIIYNIAGAQKIGVHLIYRNALNGVGGTALACTLRPQFSLDGTNWTAGQPLFTSTSTSSTTNQEIWGVVYSRGDTLVSQANGARWAGIAKYMRFQTSQTFGNETTFVNYAGVHIHYPPDPRQ